MSEEEARLARLREIRSESFVRFHLRVMDHLRAVANAERLTPEGERIVRRAFESATDSYRCAQGLIFAKAYVTAKT